ncbi:MAG: orotate phosphoribosyltransferase [Clostridiales bacterium]|nr:orotate phosphoribosyltransferase [Clostridiales bacterium]
MNYKQEFIEFMVRSDVLTFGDFTTKSGRKTPYFVNTGKYKTGAQISKLGDYYAACIKEHINDEVDALFGPAYKGIPLAVTTASSLFRNYEMDISYTFNRKEAKDHGEGGTIVGYKPKDGDKIVIIEDVITAGTSIRESVPLLKSIADVDITSVVISVDRLERGKGDKTTLQEIKDDFGIKTYSIVNTHDIIEYLHNKEIDGKVIINDDMKAKMKEYMALYCVS